MVPKDELSKIPSREVIQKELQEETAARLSRIDAEFADGFEFINKYNDTVSIFGSAMHWTDKNSSYHKARELAKLLSDDGYSIVTGGGAGIMEAGDRGAEEVGGHAVGLNILLPREQGINPYVNDSMTFRYFFTRKVLLAYGAMAYIYFPGGYGTFDELFEILTLVQTKKMPPAPVILVGSEFWTALDLFIRTYMLKEFKTITEQELDLYTITDDPMVVKALVDEHRDKVSPLAKPSESDPEETVDSTMAL